MKEIKIKVDIQGGKEVEKVQKNVKELDNTSKQTAEGGLKGLVEESGLLSEELDVLTRIQQTYNTALKALGLSANTAASSTGTLSKALRVLKVALISTGIGAIAVAVGTLASAFLSTQEGVDALNRVLVPLKEGLNGVFGVIQDIATNFGDVIDGVVSGFQRVANIALEVARGNFRTAFNESKELLADGIDLATGFGDELVDAYQRGAENGRQIVELEKELQELRRDSIVPLERLNREFEQLDTVSDNINLSFQQRIDATNRAVEVAEEENQIRGRILDREIEILQLKQEQNDTSREEQIELQRLIAQREQFDAERISRTRTLENRRNALIEQQRKAQEAELEAERKIQEEKEETARKEAEQAAELAAREAQEEDQRVFREREIQNQLAQIRAQSFQEKQQARLEQLELEKEQRLLEIESEVEDETLKQQEIALVKAQFEEQVTQIQEENAEARVKIAEAETAARQELVGKIGETFGQLATLIGEQTALGKALGVAQATIDTYVGANKALAQGGIFGVVSAAAVIASGLANVRQILSTKVPSIQGQPVGSPGPTPTFTSANVAPPDVQDQEIQTVNTVLDEEINVNVGVSETEITETQSNVREIENNANFE